MDQYVTGAVIRELREKNRMTQLQLAEKLGVRRIFFYCNRDGLFTIDPVKGVDDKESGYDDSQERRELEKVADMLFGRGSQFRK